MQLLRQAAELSEEEGVNYETGQQQPGVALKREQYAPREDKSHDQVNEQRQNEFHGGTITRIDVLATELQYGLRQIVFP